MTVIKASLFFIFFYVHITLSNDKLSIVSQGQLRPFSDCHELVVPYQKLSNETYNVQIDNTYYQVKDLNHLVEIKELLLQKRIDLCLPELHNDSCISTSFLHSDFIEIIKEISEKTNRDKKQCENYISYIRLLGSIEGLEEKQLLKIPKSKKLSDLFLKLLSSKDDNEIIDMYAICGRSESSDRFVKNLIITGAVKECIVPSMLDWKDALIIADNISKNFKGKNIMEVSRNQDKILQQSTMQLTKGVLLNQIKNLAPDYQEPRQLIQGLSSYQSLMKHQNREDLSDYIKYVFSPDVMFEIGQALMPILIPPMLKDQLPANNERQSLIDDKIMPVIEQSYQKCIEPYLKYAQIPSPKNISEIIERRKEQEKKYCDAYPQHCPEEGNCDSQVNYYSMDQHSSDQDVISACLLQAVTKGMEPILDANIKSSASAMGITKNLNKYSEVSWKTMLSCLNTNIGSGQKNQDQYNILSDNGHEPLKHLSIDQFQDIVSSCSNEVRLKLTKEIVANLGFMQDIFPDKEERTRLTSQVIVQSQQECKSNSVSTDDCEHIIEMNISYQAVRQTLKDKLVNNDIAISQFDILDQYETCSNHARQSALNDIKNPDRFTNHYKCIKEAISLTASHIASKQFQQEIPSSVSDQQFYLSLAPKVEKITKECFQETISRKTKTWEGLKNELDRNIDFFDQVISECEKKITHIIMPYVVDNEVRQSIKPLADLGYLTLNDKSDVLNNAVKGLLQDYGLEQPKDSQPFKQSLHYIISSQNDLSQDDFLKNLESNLEQSAAKMIHTNIIKSIDYPHKKQKDINLFASSFTPSCLIALQGLGESSNDSTDSTITLSEISKHLSNALDYASRLKPSKYSENLSALKSECRKLASSSHNFNRIEDTEFARFLSRGAIYLQTKAEIKNSIDEDIAAQIRQLHKDDPFYDIKKSYINDLKENMSRLIKDKMTPDYFEARVLSNPFISNHIDNNLATLMNTDASKAHNQLSHKISNSIFTDIKPGSFASEFARLQITSSIGRTGIESTIQTALETRFVGGIIPRRLENAVIKTFQDKANIINALNWEQLPHDQRADLILALNTIAISGRIETKSYGQDTREKLLSTLENDYTFSQSALDINSVQASKSMVAEQKLADLNKRVLQDLDDHVFQNGYGLFRQQLSKSLEKEITELGISNMDKKDQVQVRFMLEDEISTSFLESRILNIIEPHIKKTIKENIEITSTSSDK